MCNVLFDQILDGCFFSLISFAILFLMLHLTLLVLREVQGNSFMERVVKCWNGQLGEMMGSPSLKVFTKLLGVALCHGLIDKVEIFQDFWTWLSWTIFSNLNDLVFLWNKDGKILCSIIWNYSTNRFCVCQFIFTMIDSAVVSSRECCLWKKVDMVQMKLNMAKINWRLLILSSFNTT